MKDGLIKLLATAACIFPLVSAEAVQLSGSIGFTGSAELDSTSLAGATKFTNITATVLGGSQSGDYASVPTGLDVDWTLFTFSPEQVPVEPLWSFTSEGILYRFNATSMTVVLNTGGPQPFLNISGEGIAFITDFDPTPGTWSLTVTAGELGNEARFTFGAGVNVPSVPDGGATGILAGLAVCGLIAFRKITA